MMLGNLLVSIFILFLCIVLICLSAVVVFATANEIRKQHNKSKEDRWR